MGPVIAAAPAEKLVVEVMVNLDGKIWVDRIGERLESADADRILRLPADHLGEVVTRDRLCISATLRRKNVVGLSALSIPLHLGVQAIFGVVLATGHFILIRRLRRLNQLRPTLRAGVLHKPSAGFPSIEPQRRGGHPFRHAPAGRQGASDRPRQTHPDHDAEDRAYAGHNGQPTVLLSPGALLYRQARQIGRRAVHPLNRRA
jgi:hypothetical protein